jgi:DNA-binding MarR family transcriptional regulator
MAPTDVEIRILESISRNEQSLRQRDIARIAGLSLGMTNAILKRLARAGLLSMRKINSRNIRYLATPAGLERVAQRSYRYLRRTVGNIVRYKEAIDLLIADSMAHGARGVVLAGPSELTFIVEHLCEKRGVAFRAVRDSREVPIPPDWLVLHGERVGRSGVREKEKLMTAYLREVLGRASGGSEEGGVS